MNGRAVRGALHATDSSDNTRLSAIASSTDWTFSSLPSSLYSSFLPQLRVNCSCPFQNGNQCHCTLQVRWLLVASTELVSFRVSYDHGESLMVDTGSKPVLKKHLITWMSEMSFVWPAWCVCIFVCDTVKSTKRTGSRIQKMSTEARARSLETRSAHRFAPPKLLFAYNPPGAQTRRIALVTGLQEKHLWWTSIDKGSTPPRGVPASMFDRSRQCWWAKDYTSPTKHHHDTSLQVEHDWKIWQECQQTSQHKACFQSSTERSFLLLGSCRRALSFQLRLVLVLKLIYTSWASFTNGCSWK